MAVYIEVRVWQNEATVRVIPNPNDTFKPWQEKQLGRHANDRGFHTSGAMFYFSQHHARHRHRDLTGRWPNLRQIARATRARSNKARAVRSARNAAPPSRPRDRAVNDHGVDDSVHLSAKLLMEVLLVCEACRLAPPAQPATRARVSWGTRCSIHPAAFPGKWRKVNKSYSSASAVFSRCVCCSRRVNENPNVAADQCCLALLLFFFGCFFFVQRTSYCDGEIEWPTADISCWFYLPSC